MSAATDAGTSIHEVAPDIFRISTFIAASDLQFNQFLVKDDEPVLIRRPCASSASAISRPTSAGR